MNPRHISEVPEYIEETKRKKDGSEETVQIPRRAVAPYNFVELPEKVVEAELPLPEGDRYHSERHTGRIECTLITESPLYTRCGLTTDNFAKYSEIPEKYLKPPKDATDQQKKQWEEEKKRWETERRKTLAPFFTYRSDKFPVLPGSSLRGMLRTLVEIISFGKIDRVSNEHRLFFRAVAANPEKDSLGEAYKIYVDPKKVKAGYLKKDSEGWYIQPAKTEQGATFAWVRETPLNLQNFKKFNDNKYEPQYISVSYRSVAVDNTDRAKPKRLFANDVELPDTHPKKGVLVTSGNMKQGNELSPRRNHCVVFECLIFEANSTSRKLRVDNTAIEHYRNAMTDFQKKSPFDKDWGIIEEKEKHPVFYSHPENGNTVGFFGQSPNFRIPYSPEGNGHATTVADFIPKDLTKIGLVDLADAIFGWIKRETDKEKLPDGVDKQRAGRVFITDAIYQSDKDGIWYENNPVTPQILASPKPTCFPHYLVQPEENNPDAHPSQLKHYANQPIQDTVIRGHKLYWHKGSNPDFKLPPPPAPKKVIDLQKKVLDTHTSEVSDTQTTQIKPIKQGVVFKFDIHFENLSDVELGALLWVLDIAKNDNYRLSLGMGKPLGLGAVKIEPTLHLSRRQKRYKKLFDSNNSWEKGEIESSKDLGNYVSKFESYMLEKLNHTGDFKNLCRIKMLLAMLSWPGITDVENNTRYMEIKRERKPRIGDDPNEYKQRPVLPDPLDVMREVTGIKIECDRLSPFLPKKSTQQITQLFSEGQEIEAKIFDIKVEEGQKLKTTIIYEIQDSDCLAKEDIYKQKVSLAVGDVLKVSIVKVQGKSVRRVKRV